MLCTRSGYNKLRSTDQSLFVTVFQQLLGLGVHWSVVPISSNKAVPQYPYNGLIWLDVPLKLHVDFWRLCLFPKKGVSNSDFCNSVGVNSWVLHGPRFFSLISWIRKWTLSAGWEVCVEYHQNIPQFRGFRFEHFILLGSQFHSAFLGTPQALCGPRLVRSCSVPEEFILHRFRKF